MDNTLFVCECGDVDHQLIVSFCDEKEFNDLIFLQIHLTDIGFWNRFRYALKYIFGKKSRYNGGAFGEIIMNRKTTFELIEVLQKHYEKMK